MWSIRKQKLDHLVLQLLISKSISKTLVARKKPTGKSLLVFSKYDMNCNLRYRIMEAANASKNKPHPISI